MTLPAVTVAQLEALAALGRLLTDGGVEHWVFGGWAVDLHLGRVTREHEDVDVAVWARNVGRVATLLQEAGWRPDEDGGGWRAYVRGPVRLEVAVLARDPDGTVFTPLTEGRGEWPAGSFGQQEGEVHGVRVRVVSRASLVTDKAGPRDDPRAAAKDRADVAALTAAAEERNR